eukprot:symbB.v1.2.035380.t1/scaffold4749.1/size37708/2
MALQRALDLHRRVPPERWCLQKTEFDDFVDMVYEAWCSHRIPNLPIHSNQSNSLHEDPKHGPNLYAVNTSLVKPLTLAAGGASYALIKHPEGLKCEVFVSHSWDGGIFHLRRKIHIAWPQLHQLQNLYCCLLSNPQNLDLDEFIGGNLLQSAFALALHRATHLLVVPNPSVGVYSRLWCVYEAYLGAKWKKIYLLPVRPRARETCKYWFSSVGKCLLVGCVFGSITFISLKLFVGQERGIYSWLALIYRISSVAVLLVVVPYRHASWSLCMMTFASWFGCAFVLVDVVWAYETLKQSGGQDWAPLVLHYGWFTNLTFINVLVTVLLAILKGETAGFEEQRSMMQFESLYTSHCSNPTDEQRIREAITGAEKEVETVIRVLLAAGAYTDNLRLAHDSGLDIDRDGMTDVKTGLLLGVVFWMTSTLDLFADIQICHSDYQTSMSVLCCLYGLTVLLVPIFVARLEENGPDAAASLAEFPEAVEALFLQQELASDGRCEVKLYDSHCKTVALAVDEFIPCHPREWWDDEGTPLFARPNGNEAWVLLLEKAFAKMLGSYTALSGGNCCSAFRAFTGENSYVWARSEGEMARVEGEWKKMQLAEGEDYFVYQPGLEDRRDVENLWEEVRSYDRQSFLVACSMRAKHGQEHLREDGLVEAHAYSLLQAVEVEGQRLLFLRNPWGNDKRWNGRWCDGDEAWDRFPGLRKRLRPRFRSDGAFWMAWVDFQASFDFVFVCCLLEFDLQYPVAFAANIVS